MNLARRQIFAIVAIVAVLILSAPALLAQEAKSASSPRPPGSETANAVILVQYADVDEVAMVLHSFRNTLGGSISVSDGLKAISVSGSPTFVEACKEAAKKLDVPPVPARSIELTFTVLVASKTGGAGDDMPAGLRGVAEQLKKIAVFKSIRVADVQIVRVRDGGKPEVKGVASPGEAGGARISYEIRAGAANRVASDKEVRIRLTKLWMAGHPDKNGEDSNSPIHTTFSSDVEFSEGQKVVIGSLGVTETDSLILVVQARDVE